MRGVRRAHKTIVGLKVKKQGEVTNLGCYKLEIHGKGEIEVV